MAILEELVGWQDHVGYKLYLLIGFAVVALVFLALKK